MRLKKGKTSLTYGHGMHGEFICAYINMSGWHNYRVAEVELETLIAMREKDSALNLPSYCAVDRQKQEVEFYPTPDRDYDVRIQYTILHED